jgi:integrative and conjugative element protein (TIGR02256 family)
VTRGHPVLLMSESCANDLFAAANLSHPLETGGILVGVYADGEAWVTSVIEVATSERGQSHYRIPAGATQPVVRSARIADPRVGYLGDWHTHPADSPPSPTDLTSLRFISYAHPRRPNPTMLVVRRTGQGYDLDARRIAGLNVVACEIRVTGPLPAG